MHTSSCFRADAGDPCGWGLAPRLRKPRRPPRHCNAPYRLASGDRLRIIVFGQDNLSNSYSVDGGGMISHAAHRPRARAGPDDRSNLKNPSRRGCGRATCASPASPPRSRRSGRSSCSAKSTTAGQYPFINGMTVAERCRRRGRLYPARRRERVQRHADDRRQAHDFLSAPRLSASTWRHGHRSGTVLLETPA